MKNVYNFETDSYFEKLFSWFFVQDWSNVQGDLSPRWAHMSSCWFANHWLSMIPFHLGQLKYYQYKNWKLSKFEPWHETSIYRTIWFDFCNYLVTAHVIFVKSSTSTWWQNFSSTIWIMYNIIQLCSEISGFNILLVSFPFLKLVTCNGPSVRSICIAQYNR